jgi:hypothetical protein
MLSLLVSQWTLPTLSTKQSQEGEGFNAVLDGAEPYFTGSLRAYTLGGEGQ